LGGMLEMHIVMLGEGFIGAFSNFDATGMAMAEL